MNNVTELMTIDEMKEHRWTVSWSGGKDSTATIILMHQHGIPIEKIVHVRMMFNEELPATLPVMTEFVDYAVGVFRDWGYEVDIVKGETTAFQISEKVYKRSKYKYSNGNKYGVSNFMRGYCKFTGVKVKTIEKLKGSDYQMIGYAADETKRTHRLGGASNQFLLPWVLAKKKRLKYAGVKIC